jgi:hypothetical protein
MVPEQHPSMATTFKHFKSNKVPPSANVSSDLPIAPAMQAIVIDCVPIVDPQLAPIIGYDAEMIMASPEDPHAASPTNSKVIASGETRPFATCVAVVNIVFPSSHIGLAPVQVLTPATLAKVEGIFHEETMAICDGMLAVSLATCTHNNPSIASIRPMIPEKHASMTTMFEHL